MSRALPFGDTSGGFLLLAFLAVCWYSACQHFFSELSEGGGIYGTIFGFPGARKATAWFNAIVGLEY
jgi:hypothetical protein